MIGQLGWRSVTNRRSDARLTMFYKILPGLIAISPQEYMQPVKWVTRHTQSPASTYQPTVPAVRRHSFPELLYNGMPFWVMWLWSRHLIPFTSKLANLTMHLWQSPLCNPQLVESTEYIGRRRRTQNLCELMTNHEHWSCTSLKSMFYFVQCRLYLAVTCK